MRGGIVLAGGQSVRMGRDKALLGVGGTSLITAVVGVVAPLVAEIVIVAGSADRYVVPGARTVGDLYPGAGPVGGIVTGLASLPPGAHLVVACDMPDLQPTLLAMLFDLATDDWEAVVPVVDDRLEPLCAVYASSVIPKLHHFLESGGRAAHQALEHLVTRYLPESELRTADPHLRSFVNLNTPSDVRCFMTPRENGLG